MRNDIIHGIPHINGWFEHHDFLFGKLCPFDAANQFFSFARKHTATNHLNSPTRLHTLLNYLFHLSTFKMNIFYHHLRGRLAVERIFLHGITHVYFFAFQNPLRKIAHPEANTRNDILSVRQFHT